MNVHDKAYELANAIKESIEYRGMKEMRSRIDGDVEIKKRLSEK
ncbi:Control of competence regulator ComK, YlbF/YmcA [Paenibacillus sp. yr247]|nr:YlbF family regulator [Paenibacillus sp. yr247]SDN21799.1 Control of competence regulator ComK, YlbF/YmcA [Paenibacillus sp. yr247]